MAPKAARKIAPEVAGPKIVPAVAAASGVRKGDGVSAPAPHTGQRKASVSDSESPRDADAAPEDDGEDVSYEYVEEYVEVTDDDGSEQQQQLPSPHAAQPKPAAAAAKAVADANLSSSVSPSQQNKASSAKLLMADGTSHAAVAAVPADDASDMSSDLNDEDLGSELIKVRQTQFGRI